MEWDCLLDNLQFIYTNSLKYDTVDQQDHSTQFCYKHFLKCTEITVNICTNSIKFYWLFHIFLIIEFRLSTIQMPVIQIGGQATWSNFIKVWNDVYNIKYIYIR